MEELSSVPIRVDTTEVVAAQKEVADLETGLEKLAQKALRTKLAIAGLTQASSSLERVRAAASLTWQDLIAQSVVEPQAVSANNKLLANAEKVAAQASAQPQSADGTAAATKSAIETVVTALQAFAKTLDAASKKEPDAKVNKLEKEFNERAARIGKALETSFSEVLVNGVKTGSFSFDGVRTALVKQIETEVMKPLMESLVSGLRSSLGSGLSSLFGVVGSEQGPVAGSTMPPGGLGSLLSSSNLMSIGNTAWQQPLTQIASTAPAPVVTVDLTGTASNTVTSSTSLPATGLSSYFTGAPATSTFGLGGAGVSAGAGTLGAAGLLGGMAGGAIFGNKGYSSMGGSLGATAGMSFATSGAMAGTMAQFGAFAGPMGAIAGMVIGSALGSMMGSGPKPGVGQYGLSQITEAGTAYAPNDAYFYGDRRGYMGFSSAYGNSLNTVGSGISALAKQYGGNASGLTLGLQTAFSPDGKGADAGTTLSRDGKALFASVWTGANADMQKQAELALQRLLLAGLQQSNLAPEFAKVLDGVNLSSATKEQIDALKAALEQVRAVNTAFDGMSNTFPELTKLAWEAREGLVGASGGLDKFTSNLSTYYQAYYSEAERLNDQQAQMTATVSKLGLALPSTKDEFRTLVESLDLTTSSGQLAYATLIGMSGGFAQWADASAAAAQKVRDSTAAATKADMDRIEAIRSAAIVEATAARDRAQKSAEDAMSILSNAISARKDELQKAFDLTAKNLQTSITASESALNNLKSLSSRLSSTLSSMSGQFDPAGSRASAQEQIARSLSVAQLTGVMPDADVLGSALSIVAQPTEGMFASFEDYQVDFLKTANDISKLNQLTDGRLSVEQLTLNTLKSQLTEAQRQFDEEIDRLDQSLVLAQSQLETAMGTRLAVMSVEDAIEKLTTAVLSLEAANGAIPKATAIPTDLDKMSDVEKAVYEAYKSSGLQNMDSAGFKFWTDAINKGADQAAIVAQIKEINSAKPTPAQTLGTVYDAYTSSGVQSPDLEGLAFWTQAIANGADPAAIAAQIKAINDAKAINGSHAHGAWNIPMDGYIAELHKGETVLPAPEADAYRTLQGMARNAGGATSASLELEVRELRSQVAELVAVAREGNKNTQRTAELVDRVTEGGNAMLMEVMA